MAHNKNKGFSLIELIVAIAIMAVVTGAAVGIFSWLNSGKLKTTYKGIVNAMDEVRTDTMAKSKDIYLLVISSGNKSRVEVWEKKPTGSDVALSSSDIGNSKIYTLVGSNETLLSAGKIIMLKYNKTNGKFKSKITGSSISTGTPIDGIVVKYGNLSKKITLINTGKYKVSNE